MIRDAQIEILCECLAQAIPAARAYGPLLKAKITNVEEKAQTFCILVQVCSRNDQALTKNEMVLEGTTCIKWIIAKLREWDKTITIKQVCDSLTLLEGKNLETNALGIQISFTNKYERYAVA